MQSSIAPQSTQTYQFRIREYLEDELMAWFSPLTIAHEPDDVTTLTGPVRDQAELHGLISKIRDLNLTLLSVISQ
ncbi:MAG: hypothetical protein NT075_12550 [Chloroflexi bacterium]|nr:hypothetical protein [Chloroflexota bacterium]